ncbi:MAG: DMT family transporter [Pseudomonadota bacterium]
MSPTTAQDSVARGVLCALVGFAVFSVQDALVKSLGNYSAFQVLFFAMLFGYVPFSLVQVFDRTERSFRPRHPGWVLLRAYCAVAAVCLVFTAFTVLPFVQVYVVIFTAPLLISLLAVPMLGERIHIFRGVAILLGFAGVLIVLRPSVESVHWGHLAAIIGAFHIALGSVISRRLGGKEQAGTMMVFPLLANILVSGVGLIFVYQPMPLPDLALMCLTGVLAMVGQYLLLTAYRTAPAALVAPMQYSQLIWAVILGYVFFAESIDAMTVAGSAITVLAGVLIVVREVQVSRVQPNLRSRNVRGVAAAPMRSSEHDDVP